MGEAVLPDGEGDTVAETSVAPALLLRLEPNLAALTASAIAQNGAKYRI